MSIVEMAGEAEYMRRTAEDWYVRLRAEDATPAERRAFDRWLEANPDNRAEYDRCARTWEMASELAAHPAAEAALARLGQATRRAPGASRDRAAWRRPTGLAAGLAILMIAGLALLMSTRGPERFEATHGERETVTLADGSSATLNTDTEIRVDYAEDRRRIELVRGEAFFDVVPSPEHPFIVVAGDTVVRVVGTKFGLRRESEQVSVVVLKGMVAVRPDHPADETPAPQAPPEVHVKPGERLVLTGRQPTPRVEPVNAERVLAWHKGRIYFEDEPLATVIAEVNRYTARPFILADPTLAGLRLSGVFRTGDPESVAFALRESFGIEVRRTRDAIELRRP